MWSAVQRAPEMTQPGLLMIGQKFYVKIEKRPISLNAQNVIAAIRDKRSEGPFVNPAI